MFAKILIANRGEIACRVIQTAHKLGIRTVAVFSDADANALHVQMADEAVHIGGPAPADSYLVMQHVIDAALRTGAQAIHPGYGFLSENARFCKLCADHNLTFIGPPVGAIETMGSKSAAKQAMEQAGVPLLPGYHGDDQDPAVLKAAADDIGYPVLLKAVSGGGGKGMRQVDDAGTFDAALSAARREAQAGFGDDAMLVEKFLREPRHVEVQVFCDTQGNGVYLFERDCSVQRRHQKIIEEAPAPGLPDGVREQMGEAALRAAAAVDYVGAGTVEFLLDASGAFYFMEMNTRLQVEHPVTEMITRQDLVEWQLKVANGEPLPCAQADLNIQGHAFEARIYAEDPDNEFLPAAGRLGWLQQPQPSAHVRIDTGVVQGDEVGVFYDPMIAKLIVWDENRARALQRLAHALQQYRIVGVTTNIDFLHRLATHKAFAQAELSTGFITAHEAKLFAHDKAPLTALPLAGLYLALERAAPDQTAPQNPAAHAGSPWHANDNWRVNAPASYVEDVQVDGEIHSLIVQRVAANTFEITIDGETHTVSGELQEQTLTATVDGHRQQATVVAHAAGLSLFGDSGALHFARAAVDLGEDVHHDDGSGFTAPMNGTIVDVLVASGDRVNAGDTLVIMEAMKMEHAIKAPADGVVAEVFFAKGDLVDGGTDLLRFEADAA